MSTEVEVKRVRPNYNRWHRARQAMKGLHARALREEWTHDRILAKRTLVLALPMSPTERADVSAYGNGMLDFAWFLAEWRLGLEDPATAVRPWPWDGKGTNVPTHGGFFWPSGRPFTEWMKL